jgi:ferredoxin
MPKIIHYRNKCIGCGICFEMQPALWRMSKKDGKATLVQAIVKKQVYQLNVHEMDIALAKDVAIACPVKVIKVL